MGRCHLTLVLDVDGHSKQTPDFPTGLIVIFTGSVIPESWVLCDGNNQTPDLRDRFVVGASAVGLGSAAGSVSATSALTHAGAAVGAHSPHAVTQPDAHDSHVVTQPDAHSDHAITQAADHATHALNATHTHDAHATAASLAGAQSVIADGFTHSADGAHQHDAHSDHTGADLDSHSAHSTAGLNAHSVHSATALDGHSAHGVTQPSTHAVLRHFLLVYLMKT